MEHIIFGMTDEEFYGLIPPEQFRYEKKSAYTPHEVLLMTDDELLDNFAQITGKYSLSCKHCHSETAELTRFVSVIRKKCSKNNNGLYKDISVPKTCDHQTMQNNKRYSYYNDIQKAPSKEIIFLIKSNNTYLFNNTRRKYTKRIK